MRYKELVLGCVLATAAVTAVAAQEIGTWHSTSVEGRMDGEVCSSSAVAVSEATGDLAGVFSASFDCGSNGEVIGGAWTFVVNGADADGETVTVGTINGRVRNGWIQTDSAGGFLGTSGVEVEVTQGDGQFAGLTQGGGTLDLSTQAGEAKFHGTLRLSF